MTTTNKLIPLTIGAVVGIIVLASVFMPIYNEYTDDSTETYYNSPAGNLTYSSDNADHAFSYTAGGTAITIDDTNYTLGSANVYVISDSVIVLGSTNGITLFKGTTQALSNYTENDVNVTFSDGTATITYGETTLTATYTWLYIVDSDGDYVNVALSSSSTVYYEDFTELTTAQVLGGYLVILKDGAATMNGNEATYSATVAEQSDTDGEIKYVSGQISVTYDETTKTPSYVLAKASVTYTSASDTQALALLGAVPVLIVCAILLGFVNAIVSKRD